MEGMNVESIPNSQEVIDMVLTMQPQTAPPVQNFIIGGRRQDSTRVDTITIHSTTEDDNNNNKCDNNNNVVLPNGGGNTIYCDIPTDHQGQYLPEDELELQNFAQELFMGPNAAFDAPQSPHPQLTNYQDVKPVINKQEWLHANLNSTVVNQTLSDNPGEYGFRVFFDSHEKVTKNMTWTFSAEVRRLYVMLNSQCPFKVGTTHPPPDDSYIVVIPVYKDAVSRGENVVRCPHHCRNLDASGLQGKFWMNSPHPQAIYHEDIQNSSRHCLIVPFEKPHTGCQSFTYLFEFMCRNTCLGGVNRRATEVVFLLQHEGRELARAVVEVKVCACPGRDRRTDEASLAKRLSVETAGATARSGHRTGSQHSNIPGLGHSKLRHASSILQDSALSVLSTAENEHDTGPDGEQFFTIRVRGRTNFEILKRVAEGLELRTQHQRIKKRKLNTGVGAIVVDQQRSQLLQQQQHHQQQIIQLHDVKREVEIVDSDG